MKRVSDVERRVKCKVTGRYMGGKDGVGNGEIWVSRMEMSVQRRGEVKVVGGRQKTTVQK